MKTKLLLTGLAMTQLLVACAQGQSATSSQSSEAAQSVSPIATATPVATATPAPVATPARVATATPKPTATPAPSATPKPTATPVPVSTPANTANASQLKIMVGASNLCLDGSSSAVSAKACASSSSQYFTATKNSDGSVSLKDEATSLCLNIKANDLAVDPSLTLATCAASSAQNFSFSTSAPGAMSLVSQVNGGCLEFKSTGEALLAKCDLSSSQKVSADSAALALPTYSATIEAVLPAYAAPALPTKLVGMNATGAESGNLTTSNRYGYNYAYPSAALISYAERKGFTIIRVPFKADRLQPTRNGALNQTELARLTAVVKGAADKGLYVLLDPHNYGTLTDSSGASQIIGSSAMPASQFADFWARLAAVYVNQPNVIFGLMNEPHAISSTQWQSSAIAAVSAIRAVGAKQLIMIPGVSWTGAHSWSSSGSAAVWANYADSNYVFEIHQYFDSDSSGTHATCVAGRGSSTFSGFSNWATQYKQRGFLGETGWATNATCMTEGEAMLKLFQSRSDIYLGWTYFGAGWYNGFMTLNPANLGKSNEVDQPQTTLLDSYL